jgi:hypothetical protein
VKRHRAHIVVRLLVEGLVLSLVLMVWLWGIVELGSQTVVRETHYSPMAQSAPKKYVAVCHAPDTSKKGAALLGAAGDEGGTVLRRTGLTQPPRASQGPGLLG